MRRALVPSLVLLLAGSLFWWWGTQKSSPRTRSERSEPSVAETTRKTKTSPAPAPESSDEAEDSAASFTVEGRVYLDGRPVAGAEVRVLPASRVKPARTDAEGRFELVLGEEIPLDLAASHGELEGWARADEKPVEIHLEPVGTLEGVVMDEDGAPIESAGLWFGGGPARDLGRSQADGRYRVRLRPGVWEFEVFAEGFLTRPTVARVRVGETRFEDIVLKRASRVSGRVVAENGEAVESAMIVVLQDGAHQSTDYSVEDGLFSIDLPQGDYSLMVTHEAHRSALVDLSAPAEDLRVVLEDGDTLRGVVLDADGAPVPEAFVIVESENERKNASTDAEGRFEVKGLEDGELGVRAMVNLDSGTFSVRKSVPVSASSMREVLLRLEAGRELSGLVVDERGLGVADLWVEAINAERQHRTRTDSSGRFVFTGTSGPSYELFAERGKVSSHEPVRAEAGETEVRIVVQRRALLNGRVLDPEGNPVEFIELDSEGHRTKEGRFHFAPDETFESPLVLSAEGFEARQIPVSIRGNEEIELGDIVLSRGRRVSGRVLDADTGAPIPGARVLMSEGMNEMQLLTLVRSGEEGVLTRAGGEFVLESGPSYDIRVALYHHGYPIRLETLSVRDPSPVFRLKKGARVEGRVLGADGRGLSITVNAFEESRNESQYALSDPEGFFDFVTMGAGTWVFGVEDDSRDWTPATQRVPESGIVRVEIREAGAGR